MAVDSFFVQAAKASTEDAFCKPLWMFSTQHLLSTCVLQAVFGEATLKS